MKALLVVAIFAALISVGVSLLTGDRHDAVKTATTSGTSPARLRSAPVPRLTAQEINRQDPSDPRRQRGEARAYDRRPLLNALPITLQSVRFEIGGLGSDGRTTIIRANAGGLGRR